VNKNIKIVDNFKNPVMGFRAWRIRICCLFLHLELIWKWKSRWKENVVEKIQTFQVTVPTLDSGGAGTSSITHSIEYRKLRRNPFLVHHLIEKKKFSMEQKTLMSWDHAHSVERA
jgi:hypothetical protein